jgi:hypothetical protein
MVISILSALGSGASAAAMTTALDAAAVAIATSIELGTAGAIVLGISGVAPIIASAAAAYGINNLKGKTFSYSNKIIPGNYSFTI